MLRECKRAVRRSPPGDPRGPSRKKYLHNSKKPLQMQVCEEAVRDRTKTLVHYFCRLDSETRLALEAESFEQFLYWLEID